MIDYKETGKCSLCGKPYYGWGNNPEPLKKMHQRCCNECNMTKVIPERMKRAKGEWKVVTKYACGHECVTVIMDSNDVLSFAAYFDWKETTGFDGDMSECFDCYCERNSKVKVKIHDDKRGVGRRV